MRAILAKIVAGSMIAGAILLLEDKQKAADKKDPKAHTPEER